MAEQELPFKLTLDESGLIIQALAECPFKLVFELIGKLNHQAQQFYQPPIAAGGQLEFYLSLEEFSCCIKALGELPYHRVHRLLTHLHEQLQLQKAANLE